ncbi:MAG: DMT family transporter [bacterium JZ-2024 1]
MKKKEILAFFLVTLIWGGAFSGIRIALEGLTPFQLLLYRHIIGSIPFVPFGLSRLKLLRAQDIPLFILVGVFMVPVYHLGLNYGELAVSPGVASFIVATMPLFTVLLAKIFLNEPLTRKKIFALIFGLLGVSLLVSREGLWVREWQRVSLTFLAPLSASVNTILAKILLQRYDPIFFTAFSFILGTLSSFTLLPFFSPEFPFLLSSRVWAALLFLGLVSNFLAYLLWFWLLQKNKASYSVLFLYLIPLWSTFFGIWLTGEKLTFQGVSGSLFILYSIALTTHSQHRQSDSP